MRLSLRALLDVKGYNFRNKIIFVIFEVLCWWNVMLPSSVSYFVEKLSSISAFSCYRHLSSRVYFILRLEYIFFIEFSAVQNLNPFAVIFAKTNWLHNLRFSKDVVNYRYGFDLHDRVFQKAQINYTSRFAFGNCHFDLVAIGIASINMQSFFYFYSLLFSTLRKYNYRN